LRRQLPQPRRQARQAIVGRPVPSQYLALIGEASIMIGNLARAAILALAVAVPGADLAAARTPYDGSWSLTIYTRRGECDSTYNFQVQIINGRVTHANLVRLRGRVSPNGTVRVSVTVGDKHASGGGRLTPTSGRGSWSGHSGGARCSGTWSASKY
jgi:hypothetical protein